MMQWKGLVTDKIQWSGPYPRVADALVDIIANAVPRYGITV
jgi:hypothetical protein